MTEVKKKKQEIYFLSKLNENFCILSKMEDTLHNYECLFFQFQRVHNFFSRLLILEHINAAQNCWPRIIRFVIPVVFIIKLEWSVCICLTQLYDGRDKYRIYNI